MKTDAQLKKDVMNELAWDPSVKSNQVGVAVSGGVVTLSGHIDNYWQKHAIENAAARVEGVRAIAIEVDVKMDPSHKRSDSEIAEAVEAALKWHAQVPDELIQAKVEKGWVTLTGEVLWAHQRSCAESAVRPLIGVVGISNLLTIRPSVTPANVKALIQSAFARHASDEAKGIQVKVEGSLVTLSGTVHTWAERDAAMGATWSAPGITRVINDLQVV